MKITILSAFYPYRGGIAQFSADIYHILIKDNEVTPVTFSRQYPNFLFPGKTQFVLKDDELVEPIPAKRWVDTVNPFSWLSAGRKIKATSPDLIITRYWMTFFAPAFGCILGKQKKSTIRVAILDNVIPHEKRFFDRPANKFFLKRNDGFIVMSDAVLSDLLSIRPDAPYLRIDHPVYDHFGARLSKSEACEKLGLDPNRKYMLFFGFIRKYKGLDLLLKAMPHISEDVHLLLAGETYGSFDEYQDIVDGYGLKDRIALHNHYIGDDEVATYFSAADACILPYRSATQSGITSITMHFSLPVIATNVGGLPELIKDNETGLICEPEPEEIAKSVNRYFSEDLKMRFEAAIKEEVAQHSWDNFLTKLLSFAGTLRRK